MESTLQSYKCGEEISTSLTTDKHNVTQVTPKCQEELCVDASVYLCAINKLRCWKGSILIQHYYSLLYKARKQRVESVVLMHSSVENELETMLSD